MAPTWKPLGQRLHEALCTTNHAWNRSGFPCNTALNVAFEWLGATGLDAGMAIANDARIGYRPSEPPVTVTPVTPTPGEHAFWWEVLD